jgi:hypothetical protein
MRTRRLYAFEPPVHQGIGSPEPKRIPPTLRSLREAGSEN